MSKWFVVLQTKTTKSRRNGGRYRGEVWTFELDPKVTKHWSGTPDQWVTEILAGGEGEAEVLARFDSYKKVRAAMLKWHNVTRKTALPAGGRALSDALVDLARRWKW